MPNQKLSKCCNDSVTFEPNPFCSKCGHLCEVEELTQEGFDWKEVEALIRKDCGDGIDIYSGSAIAIIKIHTVPREAWEETKRVSDGINDELTDKLEKLAAANQEIEKLKEDIKTNYEILQQSDKNNIALSQEIALLKGKLEEVKRWFDLTDENCCSGDEYNEAMDELEAILNPPKGEIK